jgi:hypothetical protein
MSRHALLIGVGRYLHGYQDLTAAVSSDLGLISDALKEAGVVTQKRIGDVGAAVGYADLHAEIAEFLRNADFGADLLIYYTGHGHCSEGITYLVPSDARPPEPDDPLRYLVPVRFDADLSKSRARSVSFIIDACRTPPTDAEPDLPDGIPPEHAAATAVRLAEPGPRTTIVYAASAGEAARILRGPGAASLFTRALAGLMAKAGDQVPLADLRRRLQEATRTLAATGGLDQVPAIDVALGPGVDPRRIFEFFATGPGAVTGAQWSGLLLPAAGGVAADDFGLPPETPELISLLRFLDQAEAAVSPPDGGSARATFAEPTLIDRLARTARLILKRVKDQVSAPELLLVLGAVASLEAAVRAREVSDAARTDQDVPARLAMISPQLADAYPTFSEHAKQLLAAWCDHILALRVTIGVASGPLRAGLAGTIAAALGDGAGPRAGELAGYLVDCLHEQFLGREGDRSGDRGPREVTPPSGPGRPAVVIDGRRVAALARLIWLLTADTRLLTPELGLGLVQDELQDNLPVTEAIAPLADLTWISLGEVLDLALRVRSAPLDQALRRLTADITAFLVATTQADGPLYGLAVPHAATATRLGALDQAFRLPHIQFELSVAETYQLLMGTSLYGDERLAIRELYQNAVDACHYRRWRLARANPEGLAGWRPEIVFAVGTDDVGAYLECRDNGVGMSAYELRQSFAKVGRRFRDLPEFLDETASWGSGEAEGFRPISQFGIGVLSYFMLAERVVIKTVRSDPSGRLGDPLEVRVSSAAGLFRLSSQSLVNPPNGGTVVRLYLRPEFASLDLADVLGKIIAAPTVDTTLRLGPWPAPDDPRWEAGALYADARRVSALAVADLGIYFHEGSGRVLVNGIPLVIGDSPGRPGNLRGVTVSLDRRSKPRLSVDRGRLLSVDLPALRGLIVKAAARVTDWPDASVRWLLDLFVTLPVAGSAAFQLLRGRDLVAWQPESDRHQVEEIERGLVPPRVFCGQGITTFDITLLRAVPGGGPAARADTFTPPPNSPAAVYRERSRQLSARSDRTPRNGFPAFDDRLIRLLNVPPGGILPGISGSRRALRPGTREYRRNHRGVDVRANRLAAVGYPTEIRESGDLDGLPSSLIETCEIATELEVSIGAAALYRWAVGFADRPTRLTLTRLASGIGLPRTHNPALRVADGLLGDEDVLIHPARRGSGIILVMASTELDPQGIDDCLEVFPLSPADQAIARAFARLSPHTGDTARLMLAELTDMGDAAWRLAQLMAIPDDPVVITGISELNIRLLRLGRDDDLSDDAIAAYEAVREASPSAGNVVRAAMAHTGSLRELGNLLAVLRDTALTAELRGFITLFLSVYPAPGDVPDAERAEDPRSDTPVKGLSSAARLAISVDFDSVAPFHLPGTAIEPLPLALAALAEDATPEALRDELAKAGFPWVTPVDGERVDKVADHVYQFLGDEEDAEFDAEGRLIVADSLRALAAATKRSSRSRFRALLAELAEAGLAADATRRIAGADLPPSAVLGQHAKVLEGRYPLGADVMTLARMADLESVTLGEALVLLKRYRPLIEPRWNLPEELPPGVASRELSPAERALLVDPELGNDERRDWAELLVQASVISGLPLQEIVDEVLPLLTGTGVPTDDLRRLSAACPGPITFDDLLILGCLQTWPDFSGEEVKAITRPFCRFPDQLQARVTHWLENADAWTARSQRRPGRDDGDASLAEFLAGPLPGRPAWWPGRPHPDVAAHELAAHVHVQQHEDRGLR